MTHFRRLWTASSPLRLLAASLLLLLTLGLTTGLRAQEPSSEPAAASQAGPARSSTPEAQSPEANEHEANFAEKYEHSAVVKALGAKLGMDTEKAAVLFEVINFAVLAVLVGVFLAKFLPKTFRARTGHIQKHLVDARMATEEAAARMNSVEERLSKLDQQIAAMRSQAEHDWALEEQRVKASVEDERQKILAAAEQEIQAATTQARRQIQQFAAGLAIDQAARRLVVDAETDRALIQSFARRLGGDDERNGQN